MYSTCTQIFWYFLENANNVSTLEKYAISLAKILAKHQSGFFYLHWTLFHLHSQYHVLYCYWTFRTYYFLWSNYENLDITWKLYIIPLCIDVLCTSSFWFHNLRNIYEGFLMFGLDIIWKNILAMPNCFFNCFSIFSNQKLLVHIILYCLFECCVCWWITLCSLSSLITCFSFNCKKNVPKTYEISCFPSILITFCLYLLFDVLDIKYIEKYSVSNRLFFKPYFTKQTPPRKISWPT